jgi:D-alanyl-D-alanine dipeptidase
MIFLEKDQKLFMEAQSPAGKPEQVFENDGRVVIPDPDGRGWVYTEHHDNHSSVTSFSYLAESFIRTDAGSDPSRFYHIVPSKPIDQLRASALAATPPHETGPFRKPEMVELVTLDPAIHLDIRYAQPNNFLSTPVYTQARAFMQRPAAEALVRASHKLQPLGYGLLIHDAYRPWYVTKIFWDATPPEGKIFVADPKQGSKHNRGCAVDLTLYDLATGKPAEMPGLYDEMSPRSFPTFPGGTSLQRWQRDLLRRAMESEGFTVNESEWWHFDFRDWKDYQLMNVPFEELGTPAPQSSTNIH